MTVTINRDPHKQKPEDQDKHLLSPVRSPLFEFIPVFDDWNNEYKQNDIFKESLKIGQFNCIPETTAIRDEVIYRIKKGQAGEEDHHRK